MSKFSRLLGTDFDGQPTTDLDDVIYGGLDDPRHRDRVPGLIEVLEDASAPARERFLSCLALTTWGELAGYNAVMSAARNAKLAPWYEILIDRKFSVDSTFAQLAVSVSDSDEMAEEKGTYSQRTEAFRALVRIADSEYFEDKLGEIIDRTSVSALLGDIAKTVERGVASLAVQKPQKFDVATQLVDLACAVALVDGRVAAKLVMDVLSVASSHRALVHAVTLLHRSQSPEVQQLGDYMTSIGDEQVRHMVTQALQRGGGSHGRQP
ncbi:hypothetical protein [Streptomyces vastus]|uniref:HEAT repeat domain-containing protein n=1 Tax=Streptomyces vastus TaxID=285451 RepID=A0ABN3RUT4_9ACTN